MTNINTNPQTEEELVEYERKAVAAFAEMLPLWQQEVGLSGILLTLPTFLHSLDTEAEKVENDDEASSKARLAVAKKIIEVSANSRGEGNNEVLLFRQ